MLEINTKGMRKLGMFILAVIIPLVGGIRYNSGHLVGHNQGYAEAYRKATKENQEFVEKFPSKAEECKRELINLKDSCQKNLNELNSQINGCYEQADMLRNNLSQLCFRA